MTIACIANPPSRQAPTQTSAKATIPMAMIAAGAHRPSTLVSSVIVPSLHRVTRSSARRTLVYGGRLCVTRLQGTSAFPPGSRTRRAFDSGDGTEMPSTRRGQTGDPHSEDRSRATRRRSRDATGKTCRSWREWQRLGLRLDHITLATGSAPTSSSPADSPTVHDTLPFARGKDGYLRIPGSQADACDARTG